MQSVKRLAYTLRLSVASGIRPSLQVFFVVAVMVPARIVIDHLFGKHSTVDWKASFVVGASLAVLLYIGVVFSTFVDIQRTIAKGQEVLPSFPAATFVAGLCGLCVIFSVVLSVGLHNQRDAGWYQGIPFAFLLLAFYGWPRTIFSDAEGIWQRSRLGRKIRIRYIDVLAITRLPDGGILVSAPGSSIELTQFHARADKFIGLLSKRTGKGLI